jgi:hypothetical protein
VPYISFKDDRRIKLRAGESALSAGELNYQIFHCVKHTSRSAPFNIIEEQIKIYIAQFLGDRPNYQKWNDVSGVMIRCWKEIYRRLNIYLKDEFMDILESYDDEINVYEDLKIIENQDVE